MKNITAIVLILYMLCMLCPNALGYTLKGYPWGISISEVEEKLNKGKKEFTVSDKTNTLVFSSDKYGKKCKYSLLFTPATGKLAGIAIIWTTAAVAEEAKQDIVLKYGEAVNVKNEKTGKDLYIWYNPMNRYEKITLIKGPNSVVLAYYGGDLYKKYIEERRGRR